MKILINALILSDRNTGLGVYTYNLLENIIEKLKEKHTVTILCSHEEHLPSNCREYALELQYSNFIERNKALNKIDLSQYDLLWSTTQHGMRKIKIKQIITIHDLMPVFYPKKRLHQYAYYKLFIPRILKKCNKVITVSENTKRDINKYYKYDLNNICNAYESISIKKINENYSKNPGEYFCIVGIHYPYKNIHLVVEAFNAYPELRKYKVYIIGNQNCAYGEQLQNLINKYNLNDNFIFTGFIGDSEKNELVGNAKAIIYPSKYEGFGLPVLEAMAMGVPVLSSNSSSLPEVGGDAAVFFNPNEKKDLLEKILYVANEADRNELIQKGFENLKRFSWESTSNTILKLLDELDVK